MMRDHIMMDVYCKITGKIISVKFVRQGWIGRKWNSVRLYFRRKR